MRAAASHRGIAVDVDSAGTGDWHIGKPPDPRAIATARRHGADITGLRGRQIQRTDFAEFDQIIALDAPNLDELRRLAPASARAELSLLLDHVHGRQGESVADPYFGQDAGFEMAWKDIEAGVEGLLASLEGQPSRYRPTAE